MDEGEASAPAPPHASARPPRIIEYGLQGTEQQHDGPSVLDEAREEHRKRCETSGGGGGGGHDALPWRPPLTR